MGQERLIPLVKPMLAVKGNPFDSPDYLFEVKWDGYRALAYLYPGATELRSRNLLDITGTFPELGGLHLSVKRLPALLDGEVVVFTGSRPSFSSLQARGRLTDPVKIRQASKRTPALYTAFDILYISGRPVMEETLKYRKEIMAECVQGESPLVVSEYILEQGVLLAGAARQQGLEGIMAKALTSPYLPGKRSAYWKKIRHTLEADLAVCGFTAGKGGRRLGSLLLCGQKGGEMVYCGRVGTGFSQAVEADLIGRLLPLRIDRPPVRVPGREAAGACWVRPGLVCAVEYLEITPEGYLRHPTFKGIRFDKAPAGCTAP